MRQLMLLLVLVFAVSAVDRHRVLATTYSVTMHHVDSDTSCDSTPYRINVDEATECSESDCAASVNGLYDGVASTVCVKDYQTEVWQRFGSSLYILQVVYHDAACSNFAYARAYIANGKCEVGSNSNWFIAKLESNGSATLQFFTTKSCSEDDLFLATERASKETLDGNLCDSSEYQWFTNKDNTAAPLASTTTIGSSSGTTSSEGRGTTGTTSTDTTTTDGTTVTDSTTDTHDSATSPSTSTTDNASSSGDGDSSLSIGAIAGIVTAGVVAIATAYALIFHRDRPISIICFSGSVNN